MLTKEETQELNQLLRNTNIQLPSFRREVTSSGSNFVWLQKNILKKNPNVPVRVKELLKLQ